MPIIRKIATASQHCAYKKTQKNKEHDVAQLLKMRGTHLRVS